VLVEGEPGVGKTRLAMQFAEDRQARGAVPLYGRCESDTVVPYQPFVEALRCALAEAPLAGLRPRSRGTLPRWLGCSPSWPPISGPLKRRSTSTSKKNASASSTGLPRSSQRLLDRIPSY
jgi:hypothetical protein